MYILEGNIGAGKSTFLKLIKKHYSQISIVLEPLQSWQNQAQGQSILSNFYDDPKRWAYTMETIAVVSRVYEHIKEQQKTGSHSLLERSIYSGHYCFAKNGFKEGYLTALEWNLYQQWFDFLVKGYCNKPKGFIYLRVSPEVAYGRLIKRSRSAESNVPLSYLQKIHECHDEFLLQKKEISQELMNVPVLVIDCDDEFENSFVTFTEQANKVQDFMLLNS